MVEIESDWIRLDLPEISSWWRPPKGTTTGQVVERWEPVLSWDWRHVGRFIVIFSRLSLLWPNRKPKGNDSVGRAIGYRGCDHHIFLLESNQILYFAIYSLLFGEETKRKSSFFCTVFWQTKRVDDGKFKVSSAIICSRREIKRFRFKMAHRPSVRAVTPSCCLCVKESKPADIFWWFQMRRHDKSTNDDGLYERKKVIDLTKKT